jgi:hypothetical protein
VGGSVATARRLAASTEPSCRWVGREALREIAKTKARPKQRRRA